MTLKLSTLCYNLRYSVEQAYAFKGAGLDAIYMLII